MRYYDSMGAAGYPISGGVTMAQSFQEHLDRGSPGGVDYAVGVGNIIWSPTRGRVSNWSSSGAGNAVNFYHIGDNGQETGFYDQYLHLSKFGPDGAIFQPGQDIGARSGGTGTSSTGPHIHWDLRNPAGQVVRQWEYFTTEKRKAMQLINNGKAVFTVGQEYLHHVGGPAEEGALKQVLGDVVWVTSGDFDNILKGFGIPADKVKLVMGGKTWSAVDDIQAGSGATPAAIAKAVNDDVSKRMAQ
jgi:murein DD-endopeptidase MepM/ murein hydrolase activator NlpD